MKKSRRNNKKKMRALVIRMYNGIGALLALLGFIILSAIETTVKDFNEPLLPCIVTGIIGLVILGVGVYCINDGFKYENRY